MVPWPMVSTKLVAELYRQYPAHSRLLPGWHTLMMQFSIIFSGLSMSCTMGAGSFASQRGKKGDSPRREFGRRRRRHMISRAAHRMQCLRRCCWQKRVPQCLCCPLPVQFCSVWGP